MDKVVVVYKTPEGGVGILRPTNEFLAMAKAHVEKKHKNLPVEDLNTFILEYVAHKDVPEGLEWRILDKEKLPSDRKFRNAWTDELPTETVDVDYDKACDIKMAEIRYLRDEKLKRLDVETMKGNDVQTEKQILRDLPETVELPKTVEALTEFIPLELI